MDIEAIIAALGGHYDADEAEVIECRAISMIGKDKNRGQHMSSATKRFALATLSVPVLAALAIGLAGSAVAAPAGRPQPSDTGTTRNVNGNTIISYVKYVLATSGDIDGASDVKNLGAFYKATAARPASRTTRGATQRKPLLGGGGHTIVVMADETSWGWINKNSEIKWIVQN